MKIIMNRGSWMRLFPKFDLKMRITVLFFLVALIQLHAFDGFAQQKITLNLENVTVGKVLDEIERTSAYRFHYNKDIIDLSRQVSIKASRRDILDVLHLIFKGVPVAYTLENNDVMLTPEKTNQKVTPGKLGSSRSADRQQQNEINGTVTDQQGIPMAGVTVFIKESKRGSLTDLDGKYTLVVSPKDVIVFSFIGFKKVEIVVDGQDVIDVQMEEDITSLDEVVVNAGYYQVKDRERTGSIARVSGEDIELQPIVSPLETLYGRMAGVEISQQDGMPGSAPIIRIRGRNSLREDGNYPLYIIDGVPVNSEPIETSMGVSVGNLLPGNMDPLSTLNFANIESIEVLKDADATAIYGSRGANGVVLITTRKGELFNQKLQFNARWYSGLGQVGRKLKLLNTGQYVALREAAMANAGKTPDESNAPDLTLWDTNRYTDWQDELLGGTASITHVNLSASGGNATTSFRINGSYQSQGNVFPEAMDYQKLTAGLSLSHRSENKKLGIDLTMNYGTDQNDNFAVNSIVEDAYLLPPNAPPLYNEDGSLHWEEWMLLNMDNPLAGKYSPVNTQSHNLITNLLLSYTVLPGLTLKSSFGYTRNTQEILGKQFKEGVSPARRDATEHIARKGFQKQLSWIIEPQITYHKALWGGELDVLVGTTFQKKESDGFGIRGEGFVSESLVGDMASAELYSYAGGRFREYKYSAAFGRLGYNWRKKYFINLTGRRDGSSRFGPGNRFSNFWAIGGAWVFTEEPWMKSISDALSFGKLRGSYGTTGSDNVGDYQYLDTYEATTAPGGLIPNKLFNPDFVWEENRKLEAALELGFLKDRINLGVSWYRNRSSNQLVGYPLPTMTGFTSVTANLPATVQNTGWELELSSINIQNSNFRWQTAFNLSFPKNELISFPGIEDTSYDAIYKVGHPLSLVYLYRYTGIDPATGFHTVEDVNEDGSINRDDLSIYKNSGRQYYGGINNTISFKGFQCSFLLDFIKQNFIKNTTFYTGAPGYSGSYTNRSIEDYAAWKEGDLYVEDSYPFYSSYIRAQTSDYGWVDTSFIRLKTVSLSYDLPADWVSKIGLKSFRLFATGQNLLTISSYAGINLESNPTALTIPPLRMITGGVQLTL